MLLNTKYQSYNGSWIKFFAPFFLSSALVTKEKNPITGKLEVRDFNLDESLSEKLPYLTLILGFLGYFGHNLYAQYQHNKSLEKELKVITDDGEIKTIKASPNYFDIYTTYNISGACASIGLTTFLGFGTKFFIEKASSLGLITVLISSISSFLALGAKTKHLFTDDYLDYNFTDIETGKEISHEEMEYVKVIEIN
jgi:hypothetical protein